MTQLIACVPASNIVYMSYATELTNIIFGCPPELAERLSDIAHHHRSSRAEMIRQVLSHFCDTVQPVAPADQTNGDAPITPSEASNDDQRQRTPAD